VLVDLFHRHLDLAAPVASSRIRFAVATKTSVPPDRVQYEVEGTAATASSAESQTPYTHETQQQVSQQWTQTQEIDMGK
jgi:hypothetical protein